MDKRDRFIAEIRDESRAKGLSFRVEYRRGKGGHAMLYVGDKLTTLPSREIDPKTARNPKDAWIGIRAITARGLPLGGLRKDQQMQTFVYYAEFEPGDKRGIVVSFPDVPEAITQGDDEADACAQAEKALELALLSYPDRGLPLPKPRAKGKTLKAVVVAPEVAAKLALLDAFTTAGITKSEFARRLCKDEKEVRRLLDPWHQTKLAGLTPALLLLGKRLIVGVEEAA